MGRYTKDICRFLMSLLLLSSVAAFTNCQCNAKRDPHFPTEPTMPPTTTSEDPVEPVLAITDEMIEAVRKEGVEYNFLADLLLQLQQGQSVDINAVDTSSESYRYTALHHAIALQMPDVVEILLKKGCNINLAENKNNATPLHWALFLGDNLMVDKLLKCPNIAINAQTKNGATYLYIAASKANIAAVDKLLQYPGIEAERATYYGETPLACVLSQCSQSCLSMEERDNYQKIISIIRKFLKG
jgi:hypothetical protein